MKLQEQQFRWLIKNYLANYPGITENHKLADYEQFKQCSLAANGDIEADDLPSRRTFFRYLAEYGGVNANAPTRLSRNSIDRNARSTKPEDLLVELLSGDANYEEVEFWFLHHKPFGLSIDERTILKGGERVYPARSSSIDTTAIKGFAAGLLYAMREVGR